MGKRSNYGRIDEPEGEEEGVEDFEAEMAEGTIWLFVIRGWREK